LRIFYVDIIIISTPMKLAIVIPIFNRPEQLKQCLQSVAVSEMPPGTVFFLVNDGSTDPETDKFWKDSPLEDAIKLHQKNQGVKVALKTGFDMAVAMGFDTLAVLDSDAIIKPQLWARLLKLHASFPKDLITGFNCDTRNADGSERHKRLSTAPDHVIRGSVGGINMLFSAETYKKHVAPALSGLGNWDHQACLSAGRAISLSPSLVQHLPGPSAMGHNEPPDRADDFFNLSLPDVTLIGADCDLGRLKQAADRCTADIQFGGVVLLNPPLRSKEEYSQFIVREIHKHVKTSHMLIIQHDGYVVNWQAWDPNWLIYDYIGATWGYKDGMNVGNGGFSLRSLKLMQFVANVPRETVCHPEDHFICRTLRPDGFKFAPEEVANRFSIEAHGAEVAFQGASRYSGQFGFHGAAVDWTGCNLPHVPVFKKPMSGVISPTITQRQRQAIPVVSPGRW
jgi:glycosyltransferase involved in cell wall biosynthesis